MFKKIIKNTSLLSSGTLVSRVLGFIRDMVLSRFFGSSPVMEAFLVAFRLPNLFRSVFAEGFTDSVATPVLSEYAQDREKIFSIANKLISVFLVLLGIVTIVGIVCARQLVGLIAPGFSVDPARFALAVSFTRWTFIYLLLIGIASNMISVLYALRMFFVPAINPVFLNIAFIPGVLLFGRYFETYILVACVLVAGVCEVLFPLIALRRASFRFTFDIAPAFKDPCIRRMGRLFVPRIWSSIIYQINIFVDTIFSSYIPIMGTGAVTAVYYANRLVQFPFALVALSLSQVAVVDLSAYHAQGNSTEFKKLVVFAFGNLVFFIVPVVVFFLFLSEAVIDTLFRGGRFDAGLTHMTASVLFFYSFGLFFSCGVRLLNTCFYALKDTRAPAITAACSLVVNTLCCFLFMRYLKISGVALATSIAGLVNFILLYWMLARRIGAFDWQDTAAQFIKVLVLSVAAAASSSFFWHACFLNKYSKMCVVFGIYCLVFIIGGSILRLKQISFLLRKLRRLLG